MLTLSLSSCSMTTGPCFIVVSLRASLRHGMWSLFLVVLGGPRATDAWSVYTEPSSVSWIAPVIRALVRTSPGDVYPVCGSGWVRHGWSLSAHSACAAFASPDEPLHSDHSGSSDEDDNSDGSASSEVARSDRPVRRRQAPRWLWLIDFFFAWCFFFASCSYSFPYVGFCDVLYHLGAVGCVCACSSA